MFDNLKEGLELSTTKDVWHYSDNLEVELSNLLDDSKWNYPL